MAGDGGLGAGIRHAFSPFIQQIYPLISLYDFGLAVMIQRFPSPSM